MLWTITIILFVLWLVWVWSAAIRWAAGSICCWFLAVIVLMLQPCSPADAPSDISNAGRTRRMAICATCEKLVNSNKSQGAHCYES